MPALTFPVSSVIDLHKGLSGPVVLSLMFAYNNYSTSAWTYLALHASYGYMWCIKSQTFPDRNFEKEISIGKSIGIFCLLASYWVTPWVLISGGKESPGAVIAISVSLCCFGSVVMFVSDAQKYFTLRVRQGLITDGFFARTRHPNYLGEMIIYTGFATLAMHWIPFVINLFLWLFVFYPSILKKEKSLSRYPEWAAYVSRTNMIFPRLTGRPILSDKHGEEN